MLDSPSVANKNYVRLVAVAGGRPPCTLLLATLACCVTRHPLTPAAATVAAAARGTASLPAAGAAFVHLLAYSCWLGCIVWTTFIAG